MFAHLIAAIVASPLFVADTSFAAPTSPPAPRYAGEMLSYSMHGVMSQSISGQDAFGRAISQTSSPTSVKLHESIAITKASDQDVSMHRYGTITALVVGAKPVTKSAQGWTTVNNQGTVVHDAGKLGGLFLLPLPFLGTGSMKSGEPLAIGDSWRGKLGTKLYGMTARPMLTFTVTGERLVGGAKVYSLDAKGSVPMKEPVMTASGEPLGYATGSGAISAHVEYDWDNRRLVSMHAELNDTLHYAGPIKHVGGKVKDHQQCEVSLDSQNTPASTHDEINEDPSSGPIP